MFAPNVSLSIHSEDGTVQKKPISKDKNRVLPFTTKVYTFTWDSNIQNNKPYYVTPEVDLPDGVVLKDAAPLQFSTKNSPAMAAKAVDESHKKLNKNKNIAIGCILLIFAWITLVAARHWVRRSSIAAAAEPAPKKSKKSTKKKKATKSEPID